MKIDLIKHSHESFSENLVLDKIPLVSVANLSKGWSCFVHLHFNPEVSEKVVHTGSKAHFISHRMFRSYFFICILG